MKLKSLTSYVLGIAGSGLVDFQVEGFRFLGFGVPYFNTFFLEGTLMK